MHRPSLLILPVLRLPRVVPVAAGLALLAAVVPAAPASAASGDCTTSGNRVTCIFTYTGAAQSWLVPGWGDRRLLHRLRRPGRGGRRRTSGWSRRRGYCEELAVMMTTASKACSLRYRKTTYSTRY